jgi:uncharacterized repeat protein (TIGR01451 family)
MKQVFTILFVMLLGTSWFTNSIQAQEEFALEDSQPFITLTSDSENIHPGGTYTYTIEYGNWGAQTARNVVITLNLPMDGRSPIRYLSSGLAVDEWYSSEYGNLPKFNIPKLETTETGEPEMISVKVAVREGIVAQDIKASANLEAPNRKIGKRLINSNTVIVHLDGESPEWAATASATPSSQAKEASEAFEGKAVPLGQPGEGSKAQNTLLDKLLSSETIGSTMAFLIAALVITLAFAAGRKSKAG